MGRASVCAVHAAGLRTRRRVSLRAKCVAPAAPDCARADAGAALCVLALKLPDMLRRSIHTPLDGSADELVWCDDVHQGSPARQRVSVHA